ncbi:uncharacterized protein LOC111394889 [Olea europaea var. sylvestris]|uniref:uncharacterized protein LOC111394889 n=1 Tax=Olea europaea var. sylvestris TaxID=158386 RepID=UPI000C1CE65E|nr:uncharacterized protein LOC111394889 [Olea europaea var. sylvestris]
MSLNIVVNGWSAPSTTIDGIVTLTPVENWSRAQLDSCNLNSKALHALYMAVFPEEFRRVSMCELAKEVWDILETTHQGTHAVKSSKLQMLATRFEEIRRRDNEMFDVVYASLNDMVNLSFNLGEKILEPKIVRKILRSLPECFRPKVTAIEESKDIDTIKVEENKKKPQERQRGGPSESRKKSKSVRCHNCRDFDHVRNECPSAKRFEENAVNPTLTDNESSSKNQSEKSTREESGKYVAFVARSKSGSDQGSEKTEDLDSCEDSGHESESVEDLEIAYDRMYEESLKILATNQAMSKKVKELKLEKEELEVRVSDLTNKNEMSSRRVSELTIMNETLAIQVKHLESELELSRSQLLVFSSSSERLDNILGRGKPASDKGGLGFDLNVAGTSHTTFVRATDQPYIVSNPIPNVVGISGRRSTRCHRNHRPRNRNRRKQITGPRKDLSLKKNKNQVFVSQIGFLTDQVNRLTQLVTQLSGNNPRSRQVWVKKSNLPNLVRDRGALKGKNTCIPT